MEEGNTVKERILMSRSRGHADKRAASPSTVCSGSSQHRSFLLPRPFPIYNARLSEPQTAA